MRKLSKAAALVLLALWMPATLHCQLENLPGLTFLRCATDTPGNSDCRGDSCDAVERGAYKTPDNGDLIVVPVALATTAEPVLAMADEEALIVRSPAPTSEPPEPSRERWQYYSVLAVPVRGPSIPS